MTDNDGRFGIAISTIDADENWEEFNSVVGNKKQIQPCELINFNQAVIVTGKSPTNKGLKNIQTKMAYGRLEMVNTNLIKSSPEGELRIRDSKCTISPPHCSCRLHS